MLAKPNARQTISICPELANLAASIFRTAPTAASPVREKMIPCFLQKNNATARLTDWSSSFQTTCCLYVCRSSTLWAVLHEWCTRQRASKRGLLLD